MDVRTAFIADAQATKLVQPTEGALHDPAIDAQATAMRGVALADQRSDATGAQRAPMRVRIKAPIAIDALGSAAWATCQPADPEMPGSRYFCRKPTLLCHCHQLARLLQQLC